MNINLPSESFPTVSKLESVASLVNLYSVVDTTGGKTQQALMPMPGLTSFATLPGGREVIAAISIHDIGYVLFNTLFDCQFASITSNGTVTVLGNVATPPLSPGQVCLSAINDQIIIATGGIAYLYVISTNTLTALTTANFPNSTGFPANCIKVIGISSFFVALQPNSNFFYVSNASDGTTWSVLNFAAASSNYGNLVSLGNLADQLFVFGENSTELWYPTAAQFPFATTPGNAFMYGCIAPQSVSNVHNSLVWLDQAEGGGIRVVTATVGNNPVVVSNEGLNQELASYSTVIDAIGFSYIHRGNEFYEIAFPTQGKSWLLNTSTAKWSETRSIDTFNPVQPSYTRHRISAVINVADKILVGDAQGANIFTLDATNFTENGEILLRQATTSTVHNNGLYVTIYGLQLFMTVGQGISGIPSIASTVMLEISKDGGESFLGARTATAGQAGAYRTRVRWNQLGIARDFVLRFSITDQTQSILLGVQASIELEPEDPQQYKLGIRQ